MLDWWAAVALGAACSALVVVRRKRRQRPTNRSWSNGFVSECAIPVTLPTWLQKETEIITRDFNAVAAGSSSISKELFSKLLELHLERQPTPAEVLCHLERRVYN